MALINLADEGYYCDIVGELQGILLLINICVADPAINLTK